MQQRLKLAASVILAVWLNLIVCYGEELAASSAAYVAAGGAANGYSSLLAAFQNQQITKIVLATNYTVGDEFEPYAEQPILVDRNVTITGLPGTTPLLDLHRQAGVVQLCATCTLRLANISLSNLTRSGAGIVTFFRGQLGARIVQQNGFSVRLVCQRTDVELAVVNQTQRSSRFPSPPGGEQLAGSVNASYLGQSFPNAFYIQDVSLDVPLTLVRPGVYSGGFAAQWFNMTRACWEFVSEECVQRESPEVCIAQQTQRLLAAMAAGSSDGGARRAAAIAVPVAVGGALLLAALALLLRKHRRRRQHGLLLPKTAAPADPSAGPQPAVHRHHHRQQQQQQPGAAAPSKRAVDDGSIEVVLAGSPAGSTTTVAEAQAGPAGAPSPAAVAKSAVGVPAAASSANSRAASVKGSAAEAAPTVSDADAWARRFTEHSEHSTVFTEVHADGIGNSNNSARSFVNASGLSFSSSQHHSSPHVHSGPCASISGTVSAMVPLAVAHHGWQLTSSRTTPGLQQAADNEGSSIEWGELLGAGSFGRVYKCRWAGMDVAVKVIQHDASALEAVENEVQLQMYLNHPNIVRAFHYITHTHKPSSPTSHSTISSARAGGGLAATLMTGGSGSGKRPADLSGLLGSSTTSASQGLDTFSSSSAAMGMQQRSASWVQSHRLSPETPKGTLQWLQPASFSESATGFTAASMAHDSSSTAVLASQVAAAVAGRSSSATEAARAAQPPARVVEFEQADDGPDYVRKAKHAGSPKAAAAAAAAPSSEAGYSSEGSDRSAERAASSNGGHSSSEQLGAPPGWPILMLDQPLSNSTGPGTAAGLHTLGSLAMRLGASGTNSSIGGVRRGIGGGALEKKLRFKSADISETWLVQELCDCGTLASIAYNYWRRETEDEVQMLQRLLLLRDVAAGMEFLHSKNIVHSDLNANNVLVSSCESSPNGLVAKLADLGLSRVINQHRTHRTTHTFGTLSHMPPCLLREGRLTTRADVYAFAMVMWQLFTGEPAWHGLHYGQFFQKVVLEHSRPPIPNDMPEDYCCLMTHCWAEEPNDRPTASVVLHCLQLMISERLKLLEHEEPAAADAADLAAAAAAGGDRQQMRDGGAVGGGDQAGLGNVVADKRRNLEGPKGKAAAYAAVAAAAAAVEQAVGAAGSSSSL